MTEQPNGTEVQNEIPGLIKKALKRLGGEGTKSMVVSMIRSKPKMLATAEEQVETSRKDKDVTWEGAVAKSLRQLCQWTGVRRKSEEAGREDVEEKVYRW